MSGLLHLKDYRPRRGPLHRRGRSAYTKALVAVIAACSTVTPVLLTLTGPPALAASGGTISTVAGGALGDGGPALQAGIVPGWSVSDSQGDVFVADSASNRVRMVAEWSCSSSCPYGLSSFTSGNIYTVAGNGAAGSLGNNGPASDAELNSPQGVALDSSGNLYIADGSNNLVRMVAATSCSSSCPFGLSSTIAGDIYLIAGNGTATESGNGSAASSAGLNGPKSLAFDSAGDLLVVDASGDAVRLIAGTTCSSGCLFGLASTTADDIYTVGGNPNLAGWTSFGLATAAGFNSPDGISIDSQNNAFIIENNNSRLVMLAGQSCASSCPYGFSSITADYLYPFAGGAMNNGVLGNSLVTNYPTDAVPDANGNIVFSDSGYAEIRVIAKVGCASGCPYGLPSMTRGDVYTIAGVGIGGYSGDGGPALSATLDFPFHLALDSSGDVVFSDMFGERVRIIAEHSCSGTCPFGLSSMTTGDIYTVAGNGTAGSTGNGGPASSAELDQPTGVAVDAAGDLFIGGQFDNRVHMIAAATCASSCPYGLSSTTAGDIYTVAGNGTTTDGGDGGPATSAGVYAPSGLAVDASGNLYIGEFGHRVRMLAAASCSSSCPLGLSSTTAGDIYTVAGNGTSGNSGANGPATSAELGQIWGVSVTPSGGLLIDDNGNELIQYVAPATCASSCPYGLSSTTLGDIYTVAGDGVAGGTGNGGPATSAAIYNPRDVSADSAGDLFIADSVDSAVREVAATTCASSCPYGLSSSTAGDIYTIVGEAPGGSGADGIPAVQTRLYGPWDAAVDGSGNVFIGDSTNHKIRMVAAATCASNCPYGLSSTTAGYIYTIAGTVASGQSGDGGPATSATLFSPRGVNLDGAGNVVIDDSAGRVRLVSNETCSSSCPYGLSSMSKGYIYTIVGGSLGDGGPATSATLSSPTGIAVDGFGDQIVADSGDNLLRFVAARACSSSCPFGLSSTTAGDIYTVAGNGAAGSGGSGVPATSVSLNNPQGVALDSGGDALIADTYNNKIRLVANSSCASSCPFGLASTVAGDIYTIAGSGSSGAPSNGVTALTEQFLTPWGLSVDSSGDVFIALRSAARVVMIAGSTCASSCPFGLSSTTADDGYILAGNGITGFGGDGGPATAAELSIVSSAAVTPNGGVLAADPQNNRVRFIAATTCSSSCPYGLSSTTAGDIYTVAGSGMTTYTPGAAATADGLYNASAAVDDGAGNLIISATSNNRVVFVAGASCASSCPYGLSSTTAGDVYTIAGTGNGTYSGDGGPAASAGISSPDQITSDSGGNIYFADQNDNRIREVSAALVAPSITSGTATTCDATVACTFTVFSSGNPVSALTESGTLPSGLTFSDNGDGTATLGGTPAAGTGGVYPLTFTAANTVTPNATQSFTLTIDQAGAVTSASSATFTVGSAGSFTVTSSGYPTPGSITETGGLPTGVSFLNNGNGTATLSGTPAAGSGGAYSLTIAASNGVGSAGSQSFTLAINQSPAGITSSNSTTFTVGSTGSFTVRTPASDHPVDTLTHSGSLPSGVTFTDNGNGTATLGGTPAAGTGGTYPLTFTAANGVGPNATQSFTLTIHQAPNITSSSSTTFTVGTSSTFTVQTAASDTPTDALAESGALPSGVTFADNGNGTASLGGTAAAGAGGTYPITITASNGVGSPATQSFTLTVDQSPEGITSSSSTTFTVGAPGAFAIHTTATDNPHDALSESGGLPLGVTFTDNGDGTATLAGTPVANTTGLYPITITASNGVGTPATQSFTLTIDSTPSITSGASTTFTYGSAGSFTVLTSGYPNPAITEAGSLPNGVTLTDHGDGTASLSGAPGAAGTYVITISASNGVNPNATQSFTLTVDKANQSVDFSSTAPANPLYDGSYSPSASATSGLAVDLSIDTSSAPGACSIASGIVSFTGTGTCVLDAAQPGDVNWNAAATVQQTFTISPTVPTAPTSVLAASPSSGLVSAVHVSWGAPRSNGGVPLTGYSVSGRDLTTASSLTPIAAPTTTTGMTLTASNGIQAGDAYQLTVVAANSLGSSPSGTSNAIVPVAVAPVATASGSSSTPDGTATAGSASSGSQSISGSGSGAGEIVVQQYPSDPIPALQAPNGSDYYDVATTPGSSFTSVSFTICGVPGGGVAWWDPIGQDLVSVPSSPAGEGCDTVAVGASTTPSLADLYGSVFVAESGSPASAAGTSAASGGAGANSQRAAIVTASSTGRHVYGGKYTYSASVDDAGGPVTGGSVAFAVGPYALCTAPVVRGSAACISATAPRSGAMVLVASFSGTAAVSPASSESELRVEPGGAVIQLELLSSRLSAGRQHLEIEVQAVRKGAGIPRGHVLVTVGHLRWGKSLKNERAAVVVRGFDGHNASVAYFPGKDFRREVLMAPAQTRP